MRDPSIIIAEDHRRCPFCDDGHRLNSHGHYERFVVLPDRVEHIPVLRFLCPEAMRTVSLLPDFCLPRRQVGVAVLSVLLHGVTFLSQSIETAVHKARLPIDPKTGWSLLSRFRSQIDLIGTHVGQVFGRVPELPDHVPRHDPQFHQLVAALLGTASPSLALISHARQFHEKFHRPLA